MTVAPGDRITVTMPRSPSRKGEYVEDRGTRCRVLLDGEHVTRIVLRERVKPVPARSVWVSERVASGVMMGDGVLVEVPQHLEVTKIDHETRTVYVTPKAVPKPPKPDRSESYRAFVRKQLCSVCTFNEAECAHHHGPRGMGQKCSDYLCVPLCNEHHAEFHRRGTCEGKSREELDRDFAAAQLGCLSKWCAERGIDATSIMRDALINGLREESQA